MKKALITGITGQDGSYLAELLLGKGYQVHGIIRRSSSFNTDRIDHIYQDPHVDRLRLVLHYGDLADSSALARLLRTVMPDEIYHLGAQSHVKVSFDVPEYTADVTGLGTTRLLEAIRETGVPTRFYQASSSELYGKVREVPQNELTPFYPRSPYAAAKCYAYWMTVNYREAYGIYAVNGILFNHECVTAETPVFVRRKGLIDVSPIEDVVPHRTSPHSGLRYTTEPPERDELEVWDAKGWTRITCMTATWNGGRHVKPVHRVAARGAMFQATADHVGFVKLDGDIVEKEIGKIEKGERLPLIDLPEPSNVVEMTEAEAWLLGMMAAEGYIDPEGHGRVSNQDQELLAKVSRVWRAVTGGTTTSKVYPSGFEGGHDVTQLDFRGAGAYLRHICEELYTRSGHKRIPRRILNAKKEARLAFLKGFNEGDGLKATPCTYEFQSFKTSSATLAAGLYWMAMTTLGQRTIICPYERDDRLYYQLNLNSPDVPGAKGQHLRRALDEVVLARPIDYEGWLFDLATESGTFHAGVGQGWIHNSPRRGETFVTRKITRAIGRIKHGLQDKLFLGNLDAKRDWGYAGDYVEAMWLMLQQEHPDDYVIATSETHSVREFAEAAFSYAGLDWSKYVSCDERYLRPTEVDLLLGDASKAREKLGWTPRVSFEALVRMMVDSDMEMAAREARAMGKGK